jgi:DNA-binding HxlR family transcriptional regulator
VLNLILLELHCYSWQMLNRTYEGDSCPIARVLEVIGERWTILIVRDAILGVTRYENFLARNRIARNVLTARLRVLVAHDILRRSPYRDRPLRHEYLLTERGRKLGSVIAELAEFGNLYLKEPDDPSCEACCHYADGLECRFASRAGHARFLGPEIQP